MTRLVTTLTFALIAAYILATISRELLHVAGQVLSQLN